MFNPSVLADQCVALAALNPGPWCECVIVSCASPLGHNEGFRPSTVSYGSLAKGKDFESKTHFQQWVEDFESDSANFFPQISINSFWFKDFQRLAVRMCRASFQTTLCNLTLLGPVSGFFDHSESELFKKGLKLFRYGELSCFVTTRNANPLETARHRLCRVDGLH